MEFKREQYIQKLEAYKHNHLIKVVTGLRRVGKSYLIFNLFKRHLVESGVAANHIIEIPLDDFAFSEYRNAEKIYHFVKEASANDKEMHYVFIDEVQMLDRFVDVLNGFLHIDNLDVPRSTTASTSPSQRRQHAFSATSWRIPTSAAR